MSSFIHSVPGAGSKRCGQGCEYAPEEGVRVFPRDDKVDQRQHEDAVDGVADDAAGYVFAQTGKQLAHVLHLHNLAGD